ncbi:hypothetical protein FDECE_17320 [Fusarium decemcellulare]|nr:hypothetical protein FDECE_17320 [Fusarium decemcellulare]
MKFLDTLLSLAGGLAAGISLANASPIAIAPRADEDNCGSTQSFMASPQYVGTDRPNNRVCAAYWAKGVFPNSIEAKADERCLRFLKIGFTDGTTHTLGTDTPDDGHQRYGKVQWNPWLDTFKKFSLWGDGWEGGIGRIYLETSNGQAVDSGKYWDNPPPEIDIARGNDADGMLLGFMADHGDCIDGLKTFFSATRPEKVIMTDAKFQPSFEELNEKPFDHILENTRTDGDAEMSMDLYLTTEQQIKVTFSHEGGTEAGWEIGGSVGGEVKVEAGIPLLGQGDVSGKWEINSKYHKSNIDKTINGKEDTEIKRTMTRYAVKTVVKPGQKVRCTTVAVQSKVNLRYTATFEQKFRARFGYKYPVVGMFQNAESSQAITRCEDVKPDEQIDPKTLVLKENGTYCLDGKRVGDIGMSDEALRAACSV